MTAAPLGVVLAVLLAAAPASAATPAGAATQTTPTAWRALLERAVETTWTRSYSAEVLAVTWDAAGSHSELFELRNSRRGGLTVTSPQRYTMQLDPGGGAMSDHEQGWFVPLPAPAGRAGGGAGAAWSGLERKYEVREPGGCLVLQRPCRLVDFHRRSDGRLRERLWIDEATGFVLRRQTYGAGGRPVRLITWLTLDLTGTVAAQRPGRDRAVPLQQRRQEIVAVSERGLRALREAGWVVPDELPGGYRPTGVFALAGTDGAPLQMVYGDGLYSVSVFQQHGRPDWSTLPAGAVEAAHLGEGVHTWPGALPGRVLWHAGDLTFSLVGDVPPDELRALVDALPAASATSWSLADRMRRGFGRLVSWLNPWG